MKRILTRFQNAVRISKSFTPDSIAVPRSPVPAPVPESSEAVPVFGYPQLNAPLENLPPEIRSKLLSVLDLEELSSLVYASPIFHQQYLLDRRSLLCGCVETTLRSVTVDACAAYRTGSADFANRRTDEVVTQFLKSYQDRRSSTWYSIRTETLNEAEAVDIVAFYFAIIKPLARHYTSWALANLADETKNLQSHQQPLSRTEETRLLRSLYRFQLCCNCFGMGRRRTSQQPRLDFQSVDILKIFICLFEPWEVEEIACIYAFSKEKYNQVFEDIRWDVHEQNPKFDGQRPPTPEVAFDLDNSWVRDGLMKGTISRGLELLHAVFFTIRDHAHLVSAMQEQISRSAGYFLEGEALGEIAQWQRRQEQLSDRDQKQQRRDPLPFHGDGDLETNELRPPLAWTLIWRGTYSNLYGYYIQDIIRRWGFVMWDAARLEQTGAKDVFLLQWEADWGDDDPRDDIL